MDKVKLNIGCGEDCRDNFLNIDIRQLSQVDVVSDVAEPPFREHTVDVILASDVLEHFSWRKVPEVLKEWRRVLKPGGELRIKAPNMDTLIAAYVRGKIPFKELMRVTYGNQDYVENTHKAGFTPDVLTKLLERSGYKVVKCKEVLEGGDWKNMQIIAKR